jgi:hypothetical protein
MSTHVLGHAHPMPTAPTSPPPPISFSARRPEAACTWPCPPYPHLPHLSLPPPTPF